MQTQGGRANTSGKNAEAIIECVMQILKSKGYPVISHYKFDDAMLNGEPIHSDSLIVDILIRGLEGMEPGTIVSSKRQDSGGSTREKIYYHIDHVIKKCLPYPTILVMTGVKWTRKEKREYSRMIDGEKLIDIFFSYEGLLKWAEAIPAITNSQAVKMNGDLPLIQLALFNE